MLEGMIVDLRTAGGRYSGTDDHIYVGVFGRGGGSEFPLDVRGFNDWEPNSNVRYWLGEVWEGDLLEGARRPYAADGWNNPENRGIDLEMVDYVYLRKLSAEGGSGDNAWKMAGVEVRLYGSEGQRRIFHKEGELWLANEHGLQVWLRERR